MADSWIALTDEDRQRAFESLPDMLDGFLKKWGWLHFAKAIEDICRQKNLPPHTEGPLANTPKNRLIRSAIAQIEEQDLSKWSDDHDRVTLLALRDYLSVWGDREHVK